MIYFALLGLTALVFYVWVEIESLWTRFLMLERHVKQLEVDKVCDSISKSTQNEDVDLEGGSTDVEVQQD